MEISVFVLVFLLSAASSNIIPKNFETTSVAKPISEEVYFYHYDRDRPDTAILLKTGEKLRNTINPKLPWKFFVHGYTTSPWVSPWFASGKSAYFKKGEYNVVFIDWSRPANESYLVSVLNAMNVGEFVGKFIVHLNENGVSYSDIHLLGHSLGSHMVAFAGKYLRENAEKIGRITGLDPAGPFYETNPLFTKDNFGLDDPVVTAIITRINPRMFQDKYYLVPPELRLSKDDANFVDIIHTDGSHYGIVAAIGHCDFFPNSGLPIQPGCENTDDDNCSHARSVGFFVDSINTNNYIARECASYKKYEGGECKNNTKAVMGEHTDHSTRGVYYLKTNAAPPYGKGDV